MSKSNGKLVDEGLAGIRWSFEDAVYLNDEAEQCAELMMIGQHRKLELPDAAIMEVYGMVVQGEVCGLKRTNSEGKGYRVVIEDFSDLLLFLKGEIDAETVEDGDDASIQSG